MTAGSSSSLRVEYTTVSTLVEFLTYAVESISIEFDRWDDEYVRGPSLYFLVVSGVHSEEYADPLGENRWPVDRCGVVTEDLDALVEAARTVALERDGAVVVSADGTIQEQMVRVKTPDDDVAETVEHADWMGTKHLSASEISVREDVWATVTLSEETGRMTVFEDGTFEDYRRDELSERWQRRR